MNSIAIEVPKVRVENMLSPAGKEVPNQFLIHTHNGVYFQSYGSVIAFRGYRGGVVLDGSKWDYSKTTGKYRNRFLGESKAETERKIASGEYTLGDLNS